MSGLFGSFGSSSSKNRSWIGAEDKSRQIGNWTGANQLPGSYTPTGAGLISQYENPWTNDVVNNTMADLGHQEALTIGGNHDNATSAHAYGGSGLAVADALTHEGYARQGGLLSSQLRAQGFQTALGAAQQENMNQFQYPLQRQSLLNQTLAGITPDQYSKGKQTAYQVGYGGSGGGSSGGGGGGGNDTLAFWQAFT